MRRLLVARLFISRCQVN